MFQNSFNKPLLKLLIKIYIKKITKHFSENYRYARLLVQSVIYKWKKVKQDL